MTFLPVPKIMQWCPSLDQHYQTTSSILVTSGCSFTSSTLQLENAASWPGYMKDRCRFDSCVDYSYPGVGNKYIGDSILYHFNTVADQDLSKYFVVVMWSGIDREETCVTADTQNPRLGNIHYNRITQKNISQEEKAKLANQSAERILTTYNYLKSRKIPFAFTFYSNLLFPPFIPKRDTTFEFEKHTESQVLKQLKLLPWIPTDPMSFPYEYAFVNDYFNQNDDDNFHPSAQGHLKWLDQILLPGICKQGLINELLL